MEPEALVQAYREGQAGASDELGLLLSEMVLPMIRGDFAEFDVEDLASETIIVALANLHRFEDRGPGSFRAWVRQIAYFRRLAFIDRRRRERGRHESTDELPPARDADPTVREHWSERIRALADLLDLIEPRFRAALMHLVSGGDPKELAEREGVKPHTIRTRASRAVQALRQLIRERWNTSSRFLTPPSREWWG